MSHKKSKVKADRGTKTTYKDISQIIHLRDVLVFYTIT